MVCSFYNLSLFTVSISILLWLPVETACKFPQRVPSFQFFKTRPVYCSLYTSRSWPKRALNTLIASVNFLTMPALNRSFLCPVFLPLTMLIKTRLPAQGCSEFDAPSATFVTNGTPNRCWNSWHHSLHSSQEQAQTRSPPHQSPGYFDLRFLC
jgi:hypothetical protein